MKFAVTILCLTSLIGMTSAAQIAVSTSSAQIKKMPEKYNGYGLKNTKFKKVAVKKSTQPTATPTSTKSAYSQSLPTKISTPPAKHVAPVIAVPAMPPAPAPEKSKIKFSGEMYFLYEQSVEKKEDGSQPKGAGFEIVPMFSFYDFTLLADFYYTYDLNKPDSGSDWDDGIIKLKYKGWNIIPALRFAPSVFVEIPTSKESRENREIKFVPSVGFDLSLQTKYLNIEKFSLSYAFSYGHFDNKYTTRVNGDPATKYKMVQTVTSGYKFDPITVGVKFQFSSAYSYEDIVRNSFLAVEYVSYTFTPNIGVTLYHYNKAPLLKPNTYENNLKAYDPDSSTLGLSLDLSI